MIGKKENTQSELKEIRQLINKKFADLDVVLVNLKKSVESLNDNQSALNRRVRDIENASQASPMDNRPPQPVISYPPSMTTGGYSSAPSWGDRVPRGSYE